MINNLFRFRQNRTRSNRVSRTRRLNLETMEGRSLLAATVGVYDENIVAPNTVDFVAQGSTINNAQFAASVANAFSQNRGGVIDASLLAGVYEFGVNQTKSMLFGPINQSSGWGIGAPGDNRPISGGGAFATLGTGNLDSYRATTLSFGEITNGDSNEHVIQFGITALSLTGRDYGTVTTTGFLSDGSSVSASRRISEVSSRGDTFFGFSAPAGLYFTSFKIGYDGLVVPDVRLWFDDIGFITGVVSTNRAPVANDDLFVAQEDQSLSVPAPGVLGNDNDPDGNALRARLVRGPTNGTLELNANGSFVYVPRLNYNGPDDFIYFASDDALGSNQATVFLRVAAINDPPVVPMNTFSLPENSANGTLVGTVVANDPEANSIAYSIVGGNTAGAFSIDEVSGQIRVANSLALDFESNPVFSIVVKATDSFGASSEATQTIRLTDVLETLLVPIDIIPNDSRNSINVRSNGKVEVAIFSTANFDARSIDVNSLRFGRTGTEDSLSRNPSRSEPRFEIVDVNGDGRLDLVVRFELEKTGFQIGNSEGILTGKTLTGKALRGSDRITTR